mgnify:CR=1 FL=1
MLPAKDESLLCWWDALLLLDALLDALDLVRLLDIQLDLCPASQSKLRSVSSNARELCKFTYPCQ